MVPHATKRSLEDIPVLLLATILPVITAIFIVAPITFAQADSPSIPDDYLERFEKRYDREVGENINLLKNEPNSYLIKMMPGKTGNGFKLAAAMVLASRCAAGAAAVIEKNVRDFYNARASTPSFGLPAGGSLDGDSIFLEERMGECWAALKTCNIKDRPFLIERAASLVTETGANGNTIHLLRGTMRHLCQVLPELDDSTQPTYTYYIHSKDIRVVSAVIEKLMGSKNEMAIDVIAGVALLEGEPEKSRMLVQALGNVRMKKINPQKTSGYLKQISESNTAPTETRDLAKWFLAH